MGQPLTAAVRFLSGEREPVRVATTGNIELSGLQTIDGIALAVGDRVLVKDQTDATENGIRLASEGEWFRAPDASYTRAIEEGVTVHVRDGTVNNGKDYRFTSASPRIGTDPITLLWSGPQAAQAAAEAAQAAAEAAAAGVNLPPVASDRFLVDNAAGTGRESKTIKQTREILGVFKTLADLQATTVRSGVTTVYVEEREAGFGGGTYWTSTTQPGGAGVIPNADYNTGFWAFDGQATTRWSFVLNPQGLAADKRSLRSSGADFNASSGVAYQRATLIEYFPVTVGKTYYCRGTLDSAVSPKGNAQVSIYWYTSGNVFVSSSVAYNADSALLGSPTSFSASAVAPATAAYARIVCEHIRNGSNLIGGTIDFYNLDLSEKDVPYLAYCQDLTGAWFKIAKPSNNEISIVALGAKPGQNATAATQAALDFIEGLGGGVVSVPPPSSPFITDGVRMGDYTTLKGIGWGVIHFTLNPSAPVGASVVTNKNHTGTRNKSVQVIGLGIEGNRTNRASAVDSGIRPGHCGILIVNTDNPVVTGNYVKSATLHGINVSSDNENRDGEDAYKTTGVGTAIVTGNYVTDCGDDNITTHWSGKLIVTDNFSWAVAASHGDGSFCIEIDDGSEEFIVTGNHCWDALSGNSGGIAITSHEDTPAPRHGIVSGNNIRDCRRGIMCRDGGSISLPAASINARNIIITGNNVRRCREFHINIGTYENFVISNNIVTGGEFASENNSGIYLTGNLRNGTISGNTLTDFSLATYAIDLVISPVAPAGYFTITGNKITNTTRGIRANRPGLVITGNIIEAGTSATFPTGIFTDASTANSIIANNVVKGFTTKVAGAWDISSVVENNVG